MTDFLLFSVTWGTSLHCNPWFLVSAFKIDPDTSNGDTVGLSIALARLPFEGELEGAIVEETFASKRCVIPEVDGLRNEKRRGYQQNQQSRKVCYEQNLEISFRRGYGYVDNIQNM